MISASWRCCIQPMIFCTMPLPLAASITSVSFMAGAPSSTAVLASGYCAPSMISDQCTRSSRSGARKPKRSRGHAADERGAGFVARVVELPAAGIPAEMLLIFGVEEGALVMVEPPGQLRVAGVLEVHDGVFVAIEQRWIEELRRLVGHARIAKLRIRVDRARDKSAEVGSGRRPVKTVIVIEHPCEHLVSDWRKTFQLA